MQDRYRLGVAVKLLGAPLRSHDSRRWQNHPHLSVSLAYLRDIFEYLHSQDICFYRLSSQLAPYATHPGLPQFHNQIQECHTELAAIGDLARLYDIRLSMHPAQYVRLNSPEPQRAERARIELAHSTALLEAMGADRSAVIVVHIGGAYNDRLESRERFLTVFESLPPAVRKRLALENDDRLYDIDDTLWIHRRTGIPLVFDVLHHRCLNSSQMTLADALSLAVNTWPPDQKPKIHYSSPRTELRTIYRNGERSIQMPQPNQHSDFANQFDVIDLLRMARGAKLRAFDIMLEVKAKDLALIRLRQLVQRYAPELAPYMA